MRKFLLLVFIGLFVSCGQAPKEETQVPVFDSIIAEESSIDISMLDTVSVDSTSIKMSILLVDTKNAHTKVREIKKLKKENTELKKELIMVKEELNQTKAILNDTVSQSKKKKSFIQKVISTIKKDTL